MNGLLRVALEEPKSVEPDNRREKLIPSALDVDNRPTSFESSFLLCILIFRGPFLFQKLNRLCAFRLDREGIAGTQGFPRPIQFQKSEALRRY